MGLRGSEMIRGIDCIWFLAAHVRPDTPSLTEPPRLTVHSPPCVARPPGRSLAFQSWGTALSEPWFHRGTGGRRGGSLPREGTNPLLLQDHRPNRVFRGVLPLTKHRISLRLGFETIRGPALLGDKETGNHGAQPCSLDAPWGWRAIFSVGSVLGHAAKLPSRCLCVFHLLLRLDCALVTSHPGVHVLEMALWSSHRRQTWNVPERGSGRHTGHRTRKSLRFPDFSSAFLITELQVLFHFILPTSQWTPKVLHQGQGRFTWPEPRPLRSSSRPGTRHGGCASVCGSVQGGREMWGDFPPDFCRADSVTGAQGAQGWEAGRAHPDQPTPAQTGPRSCLPSPC